VPGTLRWYHIECPGQAAVARITWLIRRANGRHELIGGTDGDFTAAKEWASLFAHDVVFSRPVKRERRFSFAARLGYSVEML
jgi:hypothetical protein